MNAELEDAFALTLLRDLAPDDSRTADAALGVDAGEAALVRDARARCAEAPGVRRLWSLRGWFTGRLPGLWLVAPAFFIGLGGVGIGTRGELNVLTPPLLGLLAWQLVVFAMLALRALPGRRPTPALPPLPTALATRLARSLTELDGGEARRFSRSWFERARTPVAARWTATLHLGAAAIALGAIAGLYLDGLATAYTARWESTFLDADQVAMLAHVVLGPASFLTGIALPDAAGFARLAAAGVPAAPWIHLWAATLLGAAVLPRGLLAAVAFLRGNQPLALDEDPWLRQRLANLGGRGLGVVVQPLGYRPASRSHERLAEVLAGRYGAYVVADRREPLRWDAEPATDGAGGVGAGEEIVVMVSAAQTPEEEVHGPLLDSFAGAGQRRALLVAVDTGAYAAERDRRASRVAAWARLAEAHGAEVLELEPG